MKLCSALTYIAQHLPENHKCVCFHSYSYLLNPYSILTCGGFSTISITNLAMVWAIWMKLRGTIQRTTTTPPSSRVCRFCLTVPAELAHVQIFSLKPRLPFWKLRDKIWNGKPEFKANKPHVHPPPSLCTWLLYISYYHGLWCIPSLQVQISYHLSGWLRLPISPSTQ